jgi:hypothetical protein
MSKIDAVREAIPGFITALKNAKSEKEIAIACQKIKNAVDKAYSRREGRRNITAMKEIKEHVEAEFSSKLVDAEVASEFPYYYAEDGKGKGKRLQHLAYKYLKDERNPQTDWSDLESKQGIEVKAMETEVEAMKTEVVKPEIDIPAYVGLEGEDLEAVKQAIGDADIKEWVKQAMLQRANAINALRSRIGQDLSEVPSEVLMNDKKYRTNSTAARELVSRAVRVVKQWNLDRPEHKWCITNKILGELTGVTVKAVAKAVEGMGLSEYNQGQGLEPLINRFTKAAVGSPSEVMSLAKVTGAEQTEVDYRPTTEVA